MTDEKQHHEIQTDTAVEIVEEIVILEIIDLEEWAKAGKKPQHAKRYRIRIDKEYKEVCVHEMTGREILALVGKTPEKYLLSEKFHGGVVEPVKPDQIVKFHHHAVERFQTLALDPTEG
jgi:ferredoxin-fold anticodon binding domain-containing protein